MGIRTMGKVIKQLREERLLTQNELANILNVSSSTIGMWENDVRSPNEDTKESIADYFNVDMNYLYGKTFIRNSYRELGMAEDEVLYMQANVNYIVLPLYGELCCGDGMFVEDNVIDQIAIPNSGLNPNLEYFCQKATGDSMKDVGIVEGTIMIFEKTNAIDDGKIGCFCIDDGIATCKKIKKGPSFIQLIAMNNDYDPIVVDLNSNNFRVVGKLRKTINDFD